MHCNSRLVKLADQYRVIISSIIIIFWMGPFISCSQDTVVTQTTVDLLPGECLIGTKIPVGVTFVTPSRLVSNNEYLVVFDNKYQETLEIFDLNDMNHLASWNFSQSASRPGGHIYQYSITLSDHLSFAMGNKYMTYNINHGEMSLLESRSLLPRYLHQDHDYIYLSKGLEMYHNVTLENEFQHILAADGEIKHFGRYPETDMQFDNLVEKEEFFITKSVSSLQQKRIMTFYQKVNLIRIYDFTGELLKEIKCNLDGEIGDRRDFEPIYYFVEPFSTESAVYCLLVQRSLESVDRDFDNFKPRLIVLSWGGEILNTYETDIPFITFTVDTSHSKLYALDLKGVDYILSYDLPTD